MGSVVWNTALELKLIEHYKAEPVLWDTFHKFYKNRAKTHEAWMRISELMGIPEADLRKKRGTLLSSYRAYKARVKQSMRCEDDPEQHYKPIWFAYEAIDGFLGGEHSYEYNKNKAEQDKFIRILCEDSTSSSVNTDKKEELSTIDEDQGVPDDQEIDDDQEVDHNNETDDQDDQEIDDSEDVDENINDQIKINPTTSSNHHDRKRKRKQSFEIFEYSDRMEQRAASNTSKVDLKNESEDDCDLYCKLLAKKMRTLPESERLEFMYEVDGLFIACKNNRHRINKQ